MLRPGGGREWTLSFPGVPRGVSAAERRLMPLPVSSLPPDRCKSIMNVARGKLDLIKPEEVNMDEYEVSSDAAWVRLGASVYACACVLSGLTDVLFFSSFTPSFTPVTKFELKQWNQDMVSLGK